MLSITNTILVNSTKSRTVLTTVANNLIIVSRAHQPAVNDPYRIISNTNNFIINLLLITSSIEPIITLLLVMPCREEENGTLP